MTAAPSRRDLILTGASGFLGAQLATHWLRAHPDARAICLVRAGDTAAANARLHAALRHALLDTTAGGAAILDRAVAIAGDLDDAAWLDRAAALAAPTAEFIHCAANLSFREHDRAALWHSNVDATAALLDRLGPGAPVDIAAFNYVSTAYVAGDREGDILEDDNGPPGRFNNAYEESKWVAETRVRTLCAARGLAWRVFRPSIIIAHSVTHRMASQSGFYNVVEALLKLGRETADPNAAPILLPVADGTTLDLVPVDAVARELTAIVDAGARTADRTFHLTSANPLPLARLLDELAPLSGVPIEARAPHPDEPVPAASRVLVNRLRHYLPYLGLVRRFDRRNLRAVLDDDAFCLDVDGLRGFIRSFALQRAELRAADDAASRDRSAAAAP